MMGDLISRQAAIDAFLTLGFVWDDSLSDVEKEELDYAIHGIIMAYKERIEQLPSAQPDLQPTCNQLATDCISRKAAIDASCKDWCGCKYDDCPHNVKEYKYCDGCDTVVILENLPSAQPELIRCKDCKWWRSDHTCQEHSLVSPMLANDFCSRAEEREGEAE